MSRHFQFSVRVSTPGEDDEEDRFVDQFRAAVVTAFMALELDGRSVEVEVGEVERT